MSVGSLEAVLAAIGFLIPGFVWSVVLSLLVPRRARPTDLRFLEFLTLSCVNHGLWAWALYLLLWTGFNATHPVWTATFIFGIIFVSPVGLGLLSGWTRQRDAVSRFLRWLGFVTVSPVPTAWDQHFRRSKPFWTLVTLKDGSRVYGFFGLRSFAGDEARERDLYLETQFRPTEAGDWAPVEDSGGVLIKADQIRLIEFRKAIEVTYD